MIGRNCGWFTEDDFLEDHFRFTPDNDQGSIEGGSDSGKQAAASDNVLGLPGSIVPRSKLSDLLQKPLPRKRELT